MGSTYYMDSQETRKRLLSLGQRDSIETHEEMLMVIHDLGACTGVLQEGLRGPEKSREIRATFGTLREQIQIILKNSQLL